MIQITTERYGELMNNLNSLHLSVEELDAGWHFCPDFDELLIGPGMPELESCACSEAEIAKAREWTKSNFIASAPFGSWKFKQGEFAKDPDPHQRIIELLQELSRKLTELDESVRAVTEQVRDSGRAVEDRIANS